MGRCAPVVTWADVQSAALAAEQREGPHGRRIVRAWSEDTAAPALAQGEFGGFSVSAGPAAYQLSDGETVTL